MGIYCFGNFGVVGCWVWGIGRWLGVGRSLAQAQGELGYTEGCSCSPHPRIGILACRCSTDRARLHNPVWLGAWRLGNFLVFPFAGFNDFL